MAHNVTNPNNTPPPHYQPRAFGRVAYKPIDFTFLQGNPHIALPPQPSKWFP